MPRLIRPEAFTFPLFPPSNRYVSEWWPRLPSLGARGRIPPKTGMASSAFILLLAFLLPGATLSALVPIGAILVIWLALSELLFLFANRFGPFTLKRIPWNATLAARRFLPPANASNTPTELPPDLHGIYHMRGNPLPDSLVSFAGAVFKPSSNSFWLRVYDDRSWTWHGNLAGWILYFLVWYTGLEYEIVFDETKRYARIIPHFYLPILPFLSKHLPPTLIRPGSDRFPPRFRSRINELHVEIPSWIAHLGLRATEPGIWIRESWFLGLRVADYAFVKVVDGRGNVDDEAGVNGFLSALPAWRKMAVVERAA